MTPTIVKTEVIEHELREIIWRRFNFPWCTGYSPKRYRRLIDHLIHKDPNYFRPHRLRSALIFIIEANVHNNNLVKLTMNTYEYLNALTLEQHGSRKYKSNDIKALSTRLFYGLMRL